MRWTYGEGAKEQKMGDACRVYGRNLLPNYFQTVHGTIGRYETPSLHAAIDMLSGKPG